MHGILFTGMNNHCSGGSCGCLLLFPKYKAIVPAEDHSELTLAVINLPRKYREAIMLYYYQDMDTAEIGIALGIAQSSVSNRLRKGRELLRITMEGRKQNHTLGNRCFFDGNTILLLFQYVIQYKRKLCT